MFGAGLIKGLSVTMRHFIRSYTYDRNPLKWFSLKGRYDQEWLEKRQAVNGKGIFTVQYPEQKRDITENFRFIPFLVYEEKPDEPRCTACGICARVCPPQCIWIERATDEKGRPQAKPSGFWIDAVICMSCGYCAEYCPFDAIKMNQVHEVPTDNRDRDMFYDLEKLLEPLEYYAQIHPTDYEREEEARRIKAEAKARADEAKKAAAAKKEAAAAAAAEKATSAKKEAESAPTAAPAEEAGPDDLKRIEGISPEIDMIFNAAGIKTYAQLADTDVEAIKQLLEEANPDLLQLADPSTWPRQAKLAATGKWTALERWQERLRGGK